MVLAELKSPKVGDTVMQSQRLESVIFYSKAHPMSTCFPFELRVSGR